MNYRLYIDESGTHNYSVSDAANKRYLALTGVAIEHTEVTGNLEPRLKDLKRLVIDDPDERITLHRDDIANKSGPYAALTDPQLEAAWNRQLFELIDNVRFMICTVVIDKKAHLRQYIHPMHPYHYCLNLLLERYVTYLETINGTGDVMAEVRGKREDAQLKSEYHNIYNVGTSFVPSHRFGQRLTSAHLKLKPKDAICGLELADLFVAASKLDVLVSHRQIPSVTSAFNRSLIAKLQPKYHRRPQTGWMNGYGKKFIG